MAAISKQKPDSARWWSQPKGEVHSSLISVARQVKEAQRWRRDSDEYHAALYAGGPAAADIRCDSTIGRDYEPARFPQNICRSSVDTLTARIANAQPLPEVLTNNGNWIDKKRAKKLSQYLEGEFWRQKFFEKWARLIVRDALVFGRGLLYITANGKEILTERAMPWEVYVDRWDARYGEPQNIYRIRSIDRGVAIARYGRDKDGKDKLDEQGGSISEFLETCGSQGLQDEDVSNSDSTVDRVWICEAWHLPTAKDAGDGKYSLCVEGKDLVDVEWKHMYFPFKKLDYAEAIAGFLGQGLVEQAEGWQYEINEMWEKVSDANHIMGMSLIVTDDDTLPDTHFVNGAGYVLKKRAGTSIDVFQPNPVAAQTYERLQSLPGEALASLGLSQMSVQSQKPNGITAAVALEALDDSETGRFAMFGRQYEAWCIECAHTYIDLTSQIAKDFGELSVDVPMKGGLLSLKWADVKVTGFALRTFNTSVLPTKPAARLDKLSMLFSSGVIDRSTFLRELQAPDLAAELDMETASNLVVDEMLDSMTYAEDPSAADAYHMPTEFIDLDWAAKRAQSKLNRATIDGAPSGNVELLSRYITDCVATKRQQATLQSQQSMAASAGQPGPSPDGIAPPLAPKPIQGAGPMAPLPQGIAA